MSRPPARPSFDEVSAQRFMRLAITEALRGVGRTSPNPAVGAVVVRRGEVLARGYHARAGQPHAEAAALTAAGAAARGADLYTTLEPCDHFGRTPPCSLAIIAAGIARVFFASSDPNPLVSGKGLDRLRRAGIQTFGGLLAEEADRLNRGYFKSMREGRPFVSLKVASTLDGKIATAKGESKWITGELGREWVQRERDKVDGVIVGAGTIEEDDPRLTARIEGGRDPARIILDSHLRTSPTSRVYRQRSSARTYIATLEAPDSPRARRFRGASVELWQVRGLGGRVDVDAVLARAHAAGFQHLMVEGGARVFSTFLRRRLADELVLFLSPKLVGAEGLTWSGPLGVRAMKDALRARALRPELIGDDVLIRAELPPPSPPPRRRATPRATRDR